MMNNVFYNAVLMFDDVQKNQFPSWSGSQGIGKLGLFEIKLKVFGNDHLCMLEMIRLASSHVRHAMLGAVSIGTHLAWLFLALDFMDGQCDCAWLALPVR